MLHAMNVYVHFSKKIISLAFVQLKMYIQGFCNDFSRKPHTQYCHLTAVSCEDMQLND